LATEKHKQVIQHVNISMILFWIIMYLLYFYNVSSAFWRECWFFIPSSDFLSDHLRTRYAALLWKCGTEKVKAEYVSENEDTQKPKSQFTAPSQEDMVNVEYRLSITC